MVKTVASVIQTSKTKSMLITNKTVSGNSPPVFLDQSNLKWNKHIDNITNSTNKKLNIM